jgi:hypothetical protein
VASAARIVNVVNERWETGSARERARMIMRRSRQVSSSQFSLIASAGE